MGFQPAQADHGAHRLGIVAVCLGLGINVPNIVGDALLFLLKPFDPLDKQSQLVCRDSAVRHVLTSILA